MQGEESLDSRLYEQTTDPKQQMEGLLLPWDSRTGSVSIELFIQGNIRHRSHPALIQFLFPPRLATLYFPKMTFSLPSNVFLPFSVTPLRFYEALITSPFYPLVASQSLVQRTSRIRSFGTASAIGRCLIPTYQYQDSLSFILVSGCCRGQQKIWPYIPFYLELSISTRSCYSRSDTASALPSHGISRLLNQTKNSSAAT